MGFFIRLLITSLAILSIPYFMNGVRIDGFGTALIAALLLGFLNVTVKPLLLLLTLPLTVFSFGLFIFVINAMVFSLVASLLPGIHIDSFFSALGASLIVSLISWLIQLSFAQENGRRIVVIKTDSRSRRSRDLN